MKREIINILVIPLAIPFFKERGASLRMDMIIRGLLYDKSIYVDLIATHLGEDIHYERLKILRIPKVPFIKQLGLDFSLGRVVVNFMILIYAIYNLFKKKQSYDLIVGEGVEGCFWAILIKKCFHNIPVIYDMHNSFYQNMKNHSHPNFFKIAKYIDKYLYRNSDYIIANWETAETEIEEYNGLIKYSIIHDRLPTDLEKPLDKQYFNGNYIVYAGNFNEKQGVKILIDAFNNISSSNKSWCLILIGDNPTPEIKAAIKMNRKIFLAGRRSIKETNWIIKNAQIAVLPRIADDCPSMKVIHYIEMSSTILAVRNSINTIFLNEKNSVLCEGNTADMTQKLLLLIRNKDLREKLSRKIELEFSNMFSYQKMITELNRIIDELEK